MTYILQTLENIDLQTFLDEKSILEDKIREKINNDTTEVQQMMSVIDTKDNIKKDFSTPIKKIADNIYLIKQAVGELLIKQNLLSNLPEEIIKQWENLHNSTIQSYKDTIFYYLKAKHKFVQEANVNLMFEFGKECFIDRINLEVIEFNEKNNTSLSRDEYLLNPTANIIEIVPETLVTKNQYLRFFLDRLELKFYSRLAIQYMAYPIETVKEGFESLYSAFKIEQLSNPNIKWKTAIDFHLNEFKKVPLGAVINKQRGMMHRIGFTYDKIHQNSNTMIEQPASANLIEAIEDGNRSAKDAWSYINLLDNS